MSSLYEALHGVERVHGKIVVIGDVTSATSVTYSEALRWTQTHGIPLVHLQSSPNRLVAHPLVTTVQAPLGAGLRAWYERVAEGAEGAARIVVLLGADVSPASLKRTLAEGGVVYDATTRTVTARSALFEEGAACSKPP